MNKKEMIKENFVKIGEAERRLVKKWVLANSHNTRREREFLHSIKLGLERITYDYRMPVIEASIKDGKVYYQAGEKVANERDWGTYYSDMEKLAKSFSPEHFSDIASLQETFIWYAYRIAKGFLTIEEVCNDSSSLGNYLNAPGASNKLEVSGSRLVGGARDGIGNTYKCVTNGVRYAILGGDFRTTGASNPISEVGWHDYRATDMCRGSAIIVLRK